MSRRRHCFGSYVLVLAAQDFLSLIIGETDSPSGLHLIKVVRMALVVWTGVLGPIARGQGVRP